MNDHSVYRDLIATQKPAHILRLSAASEQPGVNILLPETLPLFSLFLLTASPSSLLILFPAPPPFLNKFIYLYPPSTPTLPLSLSVCVLISLGTQQQQQTYAVSPLKNKQAHSVRHT